MHIWLLRTLRLFWEELLTSLKKSTVWKCLYISRSQIKFNKILGLIHLNGTDLNQKVLSQRPTNCTSRKSNIATFAKTRLISLHDQCLENSLRNVRAWLCVHGVIPSFFFFFWVQFSLVAVWVFLVSDQPTYYRHLILIAALV